MLRATLCQFFSFFVSIRIIGYNSCWSAAFAALWPIKKGTVVKQSNNSPRISTFAVWLDIDRLLFPQPSAGENRWTDSQNGSPLFHRNLIIRTHTHTQLREEVLQDATAATQRIQSLKDGVDETIHAVKRIITKLRPGLLDDLGLTAAIEWQAKDFQQHTGIVCDGLPVFCILSLKRFTVHALSCCRKDF